MDKKEIDLLEKVYAHEIDSALNNSLYLYQTKSKTAKRLADEGYLKALTFTLPGRVPVTLRGYQMTWLGNAAYCLSDRCAKA